MIDSLQRFIRTSSFYVRIKPGVPARVVGIVVGRGSSGGRTKLLTAKIAKEFPQAAKNSRFFRLRAAWDVDKDATPIFNS